MTFLYSPNNQAADLNLIPYTIMWPVKAIQAQEAIHRDKLQGFEEKHFRSARLHIWYETPETYYKTQLSLFKN